MKTGYSEIRCPYAAIRREGSLKTTRPASSVIQKHCFLPKHTRKVAGSC